MKTIRKPFSKEYDKSVYVNVVQLILTDIRQDILIHENTKNT